MVTSPRESFVVGISRQGSPIPAGVGFVVGERQVITCAHIVNTALGRDQRARDMPGSDALVQIYFPMLGDADGAPVRACRIVAWAPPPKSELLGGDVAGLLLLGEGLPAGAGPAQLVNLASTRNVKVDVFGYPGDPPRTRSGAWATHRLRGVAGARSIQLDAASESALRTQPGYSGSPAIISDDGGDTVVGMLTIASLDESTPDAYAIPIQTLVDAWPEVLADRTIPACPYRGLAEFTPADTEAGLFVGREVESEQLRSLVDQHPLTVVVGPSGVGKSSLVSAGLIPALAHEGWKTASFRPGHFPFDSLAKALLTVEQPERVLTRRDLTELAEQLRAGGLLRVAAQLTTLSGAPMLLHVDQLEEVLTTSVPEERSAFLDLLLAEQSDRGSTLRTVCTLRADFLLQLLKQPDSGRQLQGHLLTLSNMGLEELKRVITEPALARGVQYEPDLSLFIAREATAGGGLPLLEFALTELWPRQHLRRIRFSDYHSLGGVSGALSSYAERVFTRLSERYSEDRVRRIMLKLIRSREGAPQATRRVVPQDSLGEDLPLAEELIRYRLAVLDTDPVGQIATIELAHEALIRAWPRFETWVNEDADFQRWLVFIEDHLAEGDTLSDRRIEEAQGWLARRPADIPTEIGQQIESSISERLQRDAEQQRYRWIARAAIQVVWFTTSSGGIEEDAPEWRAITGQTEQEFRKNGWLGAVHPEDRVRVEQRWLASLGTKTAFDCSYRLRTQNGNYRYYNVRAIPIEQEGRTVQWLGVNTDVTGQRETEEMRERLTEQLSAAAHRTARLQQATSLLAEALTTGKVAEVIAEVGRSAIGAERSAVALFDPDRLQLRTVTPNPIPGPDALGDNISLDKSSVMTAAFLARRPLLLESPEDLRRRFEGDADLDVFLRDTEEQAWVGLPLLAAGTPVGVLQFSFTRARQIPEEERIFLEALAGQCALALQRAALFEREHETAETLQRSLLPERLPTVPGLILEAVYRPVAKNLEVGGDWYDAFMLPDGKLAVVAGDVMGKGLSAAAGMGRYRTALRALALTDSRPSAVLAGLDRLVLSTEPDEQLTTVVYLVIDPLTGEGMAGSAGHLPPLLVSSNTPPRLDSTQAGTPLGWASPREEYPFQLKTGSAVVLYSDGLVENRRRGLDMGLEQLVTEAARAPADVFRDPARLAAYLVDCMMAGYEQDDDVTLLVLSANNSP